MFDKEIKDFYSFYILEILAAMGFAFIFGVKIFNPIFNITWLIVTIFIIALVYSIKNNNLPVYLREGYVRKRFFLALLVCLLPLCANVYLSVRVLKIKNADDFMKIEWNLKGKYVLVNDISLSDVKRKSLKQDYIIFKNFQGVLDGNNFTISGLDRPIFESVSYFESLYFGHYSVPKAVIRNLNVENVNIKNDYPNTGVIASINNGIISNVHISGNIEGREYVGGIAGVNYSIIEGSSFTGNINGDWCVGGIVGFNEGIIRRSFTQGEVTGTAYVGGISGSVSKTYFISDCYTVADIKGISLVGGIAGGNYNLKTYESNISSCLVLGSITADAKVGVLKYNNKNTYPSLIVGNIKSIDYEKENNIYYIDIDFDTSIIDSNWLTDILKLNIEIWDLSPLEDGDFPILRFIKNQPRVKIG